MTTATNAMVKKETMLIIAAITFLVGFLSGTVFSVYRLGPAKTVTNPQPGAASKKQGITLNNEQARAIAALEAEVEKNHNNTEAWTRLGNLYYDTNQVKKAINAYTRALDLLPANADILTDLGVMYRLDHQPDKALDCFNKAITANPRHEPSRLNKGVVLVYDLGRVADGIQAWEDLLTVNAQAMTANGRPLRDIVAQIKKETETSGQLKPEMK
jgi:cytochrome c-type biogenesis protein CcmH/NrfG